MDTVPKKKGRKWPWVVGGLILFFIVVGSSGSEKAKENTGAPNEKTEQKAPEKTPGLNEPVQSKDVTWTVTGAKSRGSVLKGSQSRYPSFQESKTTTGKYIEVEVKVENTGDDLASITAPTLVDSKDRKYTNASDVSAWIPADKDFMILTNLQPNLPKSYVFIYEVPADAVGLQLKVGVFSPKVIDLGL